MTNQFQCRVCGNAQNNSLYIAKENMFNLGGSFAYSKCAICGCLQINDYPANLSDYYPSDYYSYSLNGESFKSKIVNFLLKHALSYRINRNDILGYLAIKYNQFYLEDLPCFSSKLCNYESKILDVGCGSGSLLLRLNKFGFKYLSGIDPFLRADIEYMNGVNIYKKSIYELENVLYDCIMLHHSFEHMPEPRSVFAQLKTLLSENGVLMIRIPLCDSYAWRKYGVDWWQLDAPRHFYLHTVKSINFLVKEFDMTLEQVHYDSHCYQFIGSELNEGLGKSINNRSLCYYTKLARLLNAVADGDQACFIIRNKK